MVDGEKFTTAKAHLHVLMRALQLFGVVMVKFPVQKGVRSFS